MPATRPEVPDSVQTDGRTFRSVRGLKIAIVHPTSWPQVRRGTERFMNELAAYLKARQYEPKIICSKPGSGEINSDQGFVTEYHRSLWHPRMARLGIHQFHVFPLTTLASVLRERFDVVHCFNFTDAYAAAMARRFTGAPVLLHLSSIPANSHYRRSLSLGGSLFRRSVDASDAVITIGDVQAAYFEKRFGTRPLVIKAPVDTDRFRPGAAKNPLRPILLCASALEERRKGARFLMRAFNRVKELLPAAELQLCSAVTDRLRDELLATVSLAWRPAVHFLSPGDAELAELYAAASVLVLPSVWEAFPLVVLESLAAGTPVVGTNDGGIPELISSAAVGRTFDAGPLHMAEPTNQEGFVQAILETVELSHAAETAVKCREAAERFGWRTIGPQFEEMYSRLHRNSGNRPRSPQ